MSTALTPLVTASGLQAVFNATNDGLQARISHVALGDSGWQPDTSAVQLVSEQQRVPVTNGSRLQPNQIHVTAVADGDPEYWVKEIGFFLDDGTLFAIWSDPETPLAFKAQGVHLLLAFDMLLTALPDDSVTILATDGLDLAPATRERAGVVRLASNTEAIAADSRDAVVMTPATNQAHGDLRYARTTHRHNWADLRDKPEQFTPLPHTHTVDEIVQLSTGNGVVFALDDDKNERSTINFLPSNPFRPEKRYLIKGAVYMDSNQSHGPHPFFDLDLNAASENDITGSALVITSTLRPLYPRVLDAESRNGFFIRFTVDLNIIQERQFAIVNFHVAFSASTSTPFRVHFGIDPPTGERTTVKKNSTFEVIEIH